MDSSTLDANNIVERYDGRLNTVQLDESLMEYLKQALKKFQEATFEDGEEKELFLNNVFGEIKGKEKELVPTWVGSHLLESLVEAGDLNFLSSFCKSIYEFKNDNFTIFCYDTHGSFFAQTLLRVIQRTVVPVGKHFVESSTANTEEDGEDGDEEKMKSLRTFVVKFAKFVLKRLHAAMRHQSATFIVRQLLWVLSGIKIPQRLLTGKKGTNDPKVIDISAGASVTTNRLPSRFRKMLIEFVMAIAGSDGLQGDICNPCSGPTVQYVLYIVGEMKSDLYDLIFEKFFEVAKNTEVSYDKYGSRLMEVLIEVASKDQIKMMWKEYFRHHLTEIVNHDDAHMQSWKFVNMIPTKKMFEKAYNMLEPHFNLVHHKWRRRIFLGLVVAAARLVHKQEDIIQALFKQYGCTNDKDFVSYLLLGMKYQDFQNAKDGVMNIEPVLSSIVQKIFMFKKPLVAIRGLMAFPIVDIVKLSMHKQGSYVIESFFLSSTVSVKDKSKLIAELKGMYMQLACDMLGSRVIESIWSVAKPEEKLAIIKELSRSAVRLQASRYGAIVAYKFAMKSYLNHPENWKKQFDEQAKTKDLFADIINPDSKGKKRKAAVYPSLPKKKAD